MCVIGGLNGLICSHVNGGASDFRCERSEVIVGSAAMLVACAKDQGGLAFVSGALFSFSLP